MDSVSPGDVLELKITDLAPGGRGAARGPDGRVVFVSGALEGERVRARVQRVWSRRAEARALDILAPSPDRAAPGCPLHGRCGGCDLMHMAYPAQVDIKARWTTSALARLAPPPPQARLFPSPGNLGYRHRLRLQVKNRRLGFFAPASRELVETDHCALAAPGVNRILPGLARALAGGAGRGVVWAEVLAGEDERVFLTLGLASRSRPSPGRGRAWERAAERAGLAGLRLAPGGRLEPWEMGRESGVVCFQDDGLEMWAFPGMFCQANFQANRLLIAEVAGAAGPGEGRQALDLYAGGGNFSLPLARNGWRVLAVEGAAGARSAGLFQLKRNPDLPELRFQRGEVGRTLKRLAEKRARFDLAVLDPPRPGAKGLMPLLAALEPRRVIYVSCHPAALARDAAALGEQGYRAASLAVVDMFPQTSHVEAVLTLDRER